MPEVTFYILPVESPTARLQFVAQLLNTLQHRQLTATVAAASDAQAEALDELLWRYPEASFLPHGRDPNPPDDSPYLIATGELIADRDVLVNLREQPPPCHAEVKERLVEVVVQDPQVLATTRRLYRFYRQEGYPIESKDIALPG